MAKKQTSGSSRKSNKNTPRKTGLSSRLTWTLLIVSAAVFTWVVFIPAGNGGDASVTMTASPEGIARGKTLFAQNCAVCHGPQARGQDPSRPRGGQTAVGAYIPPALNGTGHAWHHPSDVLFNMIKNGSRAADSPMIGFEGRLADNEIRDVLGYIISLWPARARARNR